MSVPLWDDFLQGKFLDTAPHVAKIHIFVNKIWPLGDKNDRIDVFAVSCICEIWNSRFSDKRACIEKRNVEHCGYYNDNLQMSFR